MASVKKNYEASFDTAHLRPCSAAGASGQVSRLSVWLLHARHRHVHVHAATEPAAALHAAGRNVHAG